MGKEISILNYNRCIYHELKKIDSKQSSKLVAIEINYSMYVLSRRISVNSFAIGIKGSYTTKTRDKFTQWLKPYTHVRSIYIELLPL